MKAIARSLVVILVALIAVPALAISVTITTAVQLLAMTALIMGGTQHPLSTPPDDPTGFIAPYMNQAVNNYIVPAGAGPVDNRVAVIYPAEFFPVFGSTTFDDSVEEGVGNLGSCLDSSPEGCAHNENFDDPPAPGEDEHFAVSGYSQSAVVASLVKNDLINDLTPNPDLDGTEFFITSNPMRSNGGILARLPKGLTIPIIGITFYGPTQNSCPDADPCSPTASPTDDLVFPTVDVAQQYDILGGDAPARLDPLAFANSIAAYALLHGNVPNRTIAPGNGDPADPQIIFQGEYGDTDYYLITAPRLPLLMLAEQVGVPGPVLALPDAVLRVWLEDKQRRDLSPGEHVPFQLSPVGNPIALVGNMLGAIPVGIDDTVQQATGPGSTLRPLGTANVYRPFGVGGPVYDKETGDETTDDNVLPFNGTRNSFGAQESVPEVVDQRHNKNQIAYKVGNEATEGESAPKGREPGPIQRLLRGPIEFDRPKPFSGIRPSGDGPLKRVVKAVTGQRAEHDEAEAADPPKPPENDVA
jgi:PE-PPE domain